MGPAVILMTEGTGRGQRAAGSSPPAARCPLPAASVSNAFHPELLLWLSPAFPVGAYAYSHGLEAAALRGLVKNRADLETWITDLFACGSARNDLIIVAVAHRAMTAGDHAALADANALAIALQPSSERHLETTQQGNSFLTAIAASWPHPAIAAARETLRGDVAYPAALAIAAAAHAIPLHQTLPASGSAFAANLVSAAIRLSVIGQTDGQRVLAALSPIVARAATANETATLDDLGGATFSSDICSLEHETQYTRLFRS